MGPERKRSVVAVDADDDVAQSNAESEPPNTSRARNAKSVPALKRRLIPLLPKSRATLDSKSERPTARHPGPCGIRACEKISCNLESHRRYAKQYGVNALQKRNTSSTEGSSEALGAASRSSTATPQIQKTIAKSAGFPVLPVKSAVSNPTVQYLFHEFFNEQLGKLLKLIVIPFDGYEKWAGKRHEQLFENGIAKELDCLNFVGAAYMHILGHSLRTETQSAETGIMVHSEILKGLRTLLSDFDPARDIDRVLSIMYTLVMFGLLEPDKSMTALLSHKKAMIRVVESCGGLHNCGHNMPLAISLDRLIAIVTETAPAFSKWELVKIPFQRAAKYPAVYGDFFVTDKGKKVLEENVLDYCIETCRAIEILEGEKWGFGSEPTDASGEIYFLYYLRERISNQFVHLNARMTGESTVSRCVLLAAKLIEYFCLWNNYNTTLPFMIADRLVNLLDGQDLLAVWEDSQDVLKWILFGLACVSGYWKGRTRAVNLCRKTFNVLHNGRWPEDWREEQRLLVNNFVWCTKLDGAFISACEDLDPGGSP